MLLDHRYILFSWFTKCKKHQRISKTVKIIFLDIYLPITRFGARKHKRHQITWFSAQINSSFGNLNWKEFIQSDSIVTVAAPTDVCCLWCCIASIQICLVCVSWEQQRSKYLLYGVIFNKNYAHECSHTMWPTALLPGHKVSIKFHYSTFCCSHGSGYFGFLSWHWYYKASHSGIKSGVGDGTNSGKK